MEKRRYAADMYRAATDRMCIGQNSKGAETHNIEMKRKCTEVTGTETDKPSVERHRKRKAAVGRA